LRPPFTDSSCRTARSASIAAVVSDAHAPAGAQNSVEESIDRGFGCRGRLQDFNRMFR
jgi:hypothetical protein